MSKNTLIPVPKKDRRIAAAVRSLMPNAGWDALKETWRLFKESPYYWVVTGVFTLAGTSATTLLARLKGLPPDLQGILIIAVLWFLLLSIVFVFGKLKGRKKEQPSELVDDEVVEKQNLPRAIMETCPDKWLHDIADEHTQAINRHVWVTGGSINRHELLRDDPYLDFVFYIHNESVYNVCFDDSLGGTISFGRRLLSGNLKWIDNPIKDMPFGRRGVIELRQGLTKDDAIFILNSSKDNFDFRNLEITIRGSSDFEHRVVPQRLLFHDGLPTNESLLQSYPKLKIEIQEAQLLGYWNLHKAQDPLMPIGSVVNIKVHFENPRGLQIVVEGFRLDTNPYAARITSAETGEIHDSPNAENKRVGYLLDNLNSCPIRAELGEPFDGWLQFIIKGVQPDILLGATPTLVVVDLSGEKHFRKLPPLERR